MRNEVAIVTKCAVVQRHGQLARSDLGESVPVMSAEILLQDLVVLVKRRLSRRHGRYRMMTFSVVWGHRMSILTRENQRIQYNEVAT